MSATQASSSTQASGFPVDHSQMKNKATGGCPVDHHNMPKTSKPVQETVEPQSCSSEKLSCPVYVNHPLATYINRLNHLFISTFSDLDRAASVNDIFPGSQRQPGQKFPLSSQDMESTIPQSDGKNCWTYPSPQRFFNALTRKGWEPQERDMDSVVAIHNVVNEQCWKKIKDYESLSGCEQPKLVSFKGRPKDLTIKAMINNMMGYSLPFDRHDWIVERNGEKMTYIIDFYSGNSATTAVYLDVRPSPTVPGMLLRGRMFFKEMTGL